MCFDTLHQPVETAQCRDGKTGSVSKPQRCAIDELDLARPLSKADETAIHEAFLDRSVLVFRDQGLTPQEQVVVARMFG